MSLFFPVWSPRANLEMSSNLQIYPCKTYNITPYKNTEWTVHCSMLPIRGYVKQTIYQKIPVQIYKHTYTKHRYPPSPPGQCARWESKLSIFRYTLVKLTINNPTLPKYHTEPKAVHGIQLYILQNSQLIWIYQEIPMHINRQLSPSPHSKLPEHCVNSALSNVANENPCEMVN